MGLFIKNPEVERKARELAALRGASLTAAVDMALDDALKAERAKPRRKRTIEELHEATEKFRRLSGLDKVPYRPFAKAEWDALWPTGIPEIDEA